MSFEQESLHNANNMTPAENLKELIKQLIKEKQYDGVALLFTNVNEASKNISYMPEIAMDVFHDICLQQLNEKNHKENLPLYYCVEELLKVVATYAPAEELLLDLLEIIEEHKSENVFTSALRALQVVIMRQGNEKPRALEWSLNSIKTRLDELPIPDFLKEGYDEKQEKLLEQNDKIQTLLLHYITVGLFYEPLLNDICQSSLFGKQLFRSCDINRRNVLCCFLISLLGKPFSMLNFHGGEESRKTNTYTLQCAISLTKATTQCIGDPYFFLTLVEDRFRFKDTFQGREKTRGSMSNNIFFIDEKLPLNCVATYYYMILVEEIDKGKVYLVYNPMFVFESSLYLAHELMSSDEPPLQQKGLKLVECLLKQLGNSEIPAVFLEIDLYKSFCQTLCNLVAYSSVTYMRQTGVRILRQYILQFDDEGKYSVLKNLMRSVRHHGITGYLAIIYKDLVANALANPAISQLPKTLSGHDFRTIFERHICCLANGVETDILEYSDKIISSLNALRFSALKDYSNLTGFWNFIDDLNKNYLRPLREALNLSIAHYKSELKHIENVTDAKEEVEQREQLELLDICIANEKSSRTKHDFELNRQQKTPNDPVKPGLDEFREREQKREEEFEEREKTRESADDSNDAKANAIRIKILEAALPHVPTSGWTRETIMLGAEEIGFSGVAHGMFPEGGFALVSYFIGKCNEELLTQMKTETDNGRKAPHNHIEFLVNFVRIRLEMILPYKSQWAQAIALIALPQNAATSLAQLLTLVDDICYYSGDRSVDIEWYTRRIGLATVMKMTELYMLQDKSPQHNNTWVFLENRMDEFGQLQTIFSQTEDVTQTFQNSLNSAFITNNETLAFYLKLYEMEEGICDGTELELGTRRRKTTARYGEVFLVRKESGNTNNKSYAMKVTNKYQMVEKEFHAESARNERQFSEDMVKIYIGEMVLALEHMHKMDIVYRDVKLENIMLDNQGHIILVDFGLSKVLSPDSDYCARGICGTVEYLAPEMIKGEAYGFAIDWWSIGVVTYELLTGRSPFVVAENANSQRDIKERIKKMDPEFPRTLGKTTKDFILGMLKKDPKKRLNGNKKCAEDIKSHPFFHGINWNDLQNKRLKAPFQPQLISEEDTRNFSEEFTQQTLIPDSQDLVPFKTTPLLFRGYSYVAPQYLHETAYDEWSSTSRRRRKRAAPTRVQPYRLVRGKAPASYRM
uniref:non-specific serine/threonine protein kinase n=1 Tax=Glossina morsitans morsitans TaxID=37546 RepID=A0A1B0GC63_GLOMM